MPGGVLGVIATVGGIVSQDKAARERRRETRAAKAIEDRRQARQRVAQLRESQLAQANVQVAAESGGVASSSGESGALAGIQSTTAANVNFTSQVDNLNAVRYNALDRAGRYTQQANLYQGAQQILAQAQDAATKAAGA